MVFWIAYQEQFRTNLAPVLLTQSSNRCTAETPVLICLSVLALLALVRMVEASLEVQQQRGSQSLRWKRSQPNKCKPFSKKAYNIWEFHFCPLAQADPHSRSYSRLGVGGKCCPKSNFLSKIQLVCNFLFKKVTFSPKKSLVSKLFGAAGRATKTHLL